VAKSKNAEKSVKTLNLSIYEDVHCITNEFSKMHKNSHILAYVANSFFINPLNAELNPICSLLALLGAHHFLHVSRIRVNCSSYCKFTLTYVKARRYNYAYNCAYSHSFFSLGIQFHVAHV